MHCWAEVRKPGKFTDGIARSKATGQSASPAAAQNEKQHFRRIRRRLRVWLVARSCKRGQAASFCMSLRGAKRRGNPFSLQHNRAESSFSRRIRRSREFAQSISYLPGFPAGMRIATPVCALVRNDMLKADRCSRVQEGFPNGHRGLGRDLLSVCPLAPNDTEKTALFPRGGNAATEDDP